MNGKLNEEKILNNILLATYYNEYAEMHKSIETITQDKGSATITLFDGRSFSITITTNIK